MHRHDDAPVHGATVWLVRIGAGRIICIHQPEKSDTAADNRSGWALSFADEDGHAEFTGFRHVDYLRRNLNGPAAVIADDIHTQHVAIKSHRLVDLAGNDHSAHMLRLHGVAVLSLGKRRDEHQSQCSSNAAKDFQWMCPPLCVNGSVAIGCPASSKKERRILGGS